jgi:predicted ATPase
MMKKAVKPLEMQRIELEQAIATLENQQSVSSELQFGDILADMRERLTTINQLIKTDMPLGRQLQAIEQVGLIRLAQIEPETEYRFRHALVQDAAYDSLLKQDRRMLHHAVGHALEKPSTRSGEVSWLPS